MVFAKRILSPLPLARDCHSGKVPDGCQPSNVMWRDKPQPTGNGWSPQSTSLDPLRRCNMHLHARSGIDDLGPYLSRGNEKRVADALASLSRAVELVAVDYSMERVLGDLSSGLVPERDNRSVTDPQWVEKGISSYGCPLHSTRPGTDTTTANTGHDVQTVGVSGHGECSCRRTERQVPAPSSTQGRRVLDHKPNGNSAGESGTEYVGLRHVSDVAGSLDRGVVLATMEVPNPRRTSGGTRSFETAAYKGAVRSTYDSAGTKTGGKLPLSVDEVVESHILRDSYAGAPFFRSNKFVLDSGARLATKIIRDGRGFDPYVFGRRVQPGTAGPKTRLVWMAPLATTIVGTRYSKRVMEALSRKRPFVWGLRGHEQGAIISEIESRFKYVYSLDFSKFDSTVPARMIDDAFRVARTHLNLTDDELSVWRRYVNDFIHSRIIAPDGHVYQKHKGVPSGSAFTSIIDSIVNLILVSYMWEKITGHSLPHDRVLVMGDDVIVGSNSRIALGDLASAASDLGFVLSVEKSTITDKSAETKKFDDNRTHFLGHWWVHSQPHRPQSELIQRMVYPERHRKREPAEYLVRLLGYAATSVEGRRILVKLFPHQDVIQSFTRVSDAMRRLGWSDDDAVADVDLPGQLRLKRRVQGQEIEIKPSKVLAGLFGPWL